jgi:hypothetical protein
MAQKVQVVLVDDIDGGDADETVSFALDGVSYEIDLTTAHAAQLRAALEPWATAGRRTTSSRGRSKRGSGDTAKIRAWAKDSGLKVSERGRVSAEVRQAYEAAH